MVVLADIILLCSYVNFVIEFMSCDNKRECCALQFGGCDVGVCKDNHLFTQMDFYEGHGSRNLALCP